MAKYFVNFSNIIVDRNNVRSIAIDGFEQFKLNPDYSIYEYFRELVKDCKINGINLLYTTCIDSGKEYKLPEIYERFLDIITVLK